MREGSRWRLWRSDLDQWQRQHGVPASSTARTRRRSAAWNPGGTRTRWPPTRWISIAAPPSPSGVARRTGWKRPGDPRRAQPVAPREPSQRLATGPPGLDHHPRLGLAPIPSAHHRRDARLPRHPHLLSRPSAGGENIAQGGAPRKHGKGGRLQCRSLLTCESALMSISGSQIQI